MLCAKAWRRWTRPVPGRSSNIDMSRNPALVLAIVHMVAVIVGLDVLFFRGRFWERLMANVGIVLLFAAF